jgi:asparagine synthase (glutamine-hydrolysing)
MNTSPLSAAAVDPAATDPVGKALATPEIIDGDGGLGGPAAWREALRSAAPTAVLGRCSGGFAVALDLGDGRALLAVDRFARRTLCWRVEGGQLHAATRADTLRRAGDRLDPQAIYDYLAFHAIASPRTAFDGVQRLPPGHCLVFDRRDATLRIERFWQARFMPDAHPDFARLKARFDDLLDAAVARELAAGPAACFLSGGTDSSTVAGRVARVGGQAPDTYSIGFEAQGYDEMAYARIAARHFGTRHHEYYVTAADLVTHVPQVAAAWDQPFGNSSALPSYCCALRAREDGFVRMLAGDGGDELFGGNSRYAMLGVFGLWQRVPGVLRRGLLEPFFGLPTVARTPLLKKGSGYIRQANTPMPDRLQNHNLLARLDPAAVLSPAFLAQVDGEAPLRLQRSVWGEAEAASELDRNLAFDWRFTLAESDLPKVRMATALAGVTVGYPLLDDALADFSATLPEHYKLRRGKLRWFFKEALRGFLPDEILTKKKHGFGLPFGVWALRDPALAALAQESVRAVAARGLLRPGFAEELLRTLLPAHPGYYGEMVWILMMLEQWLRAHAPAHRFD